MTDRTPSHRLKRAKRALRREIISRRDAMTPRDRAAKSLAIAARLLALPEVRRARLVMVFWSFGSEVETAPIIDRLASQGVALALPRIEGPDIVPVPYRPGDALVETGFGAKEPVAARGSVAEDLDVVVTPGVAFDRRGHRVGYGRGFYDRLLRSVGPQAFRVAIGFALQVVDEVPHGHADQPVDAVVTEADVIRCPVADPEPPSARTDAGAS